MIFHQLLPLILIPLTYASLQGTILSDIRSTTAAAAAATTTALVDDSNGATSAEYLTSSNEYIPSAPPEDYNDAGRYEWDLDQEDAYHHQDPQGDGVLEAETEGHGDTSIVQNNYNVRLSGHIASLDREGILLIVSGVFIIVLMVVGIILLVMLLTRYLEGDSRANKPLVIMPPTVSSPSEMYHWRHDPVFEIPRSYNNRPKSAEFKEHPLHPPQYDDEHKVD